MNEATMHDELRRIDGELSSLERLRTSIIHKMTAQHSADRASSKLLPFPNQTAITERPSPSSEWPAGTRQKKPL
jgi:hypothetical protein